MTTTIEIRNLVAFNSTLARINRRAKRLGLQEITAAFKGQRSSLVPVYEIIEGEKKHVGEESVILTTVEIAGLEVIKMNGWTLRAISEPLNNGRNLVKTTSKQTIVPDRFFTSGCYCDHCKTSRARNYTFVVENDGGEWKQVGSTCLKDFCGNEGAESLAAAFSFYGEIIIELREYADCESSAWEGGAKAYSTQEALAVAAAITRKFGYVSRCKAEEQNLVSTVERMRIAYGKTSEMKELQINEEDETVAEQVLGMFLSLEAAAMEDNGFMRNAHNIAVAGFCGNSGLGLVAAMPAAYNYDGLQGPRKTNCTRLE